MIWQEASYLWLLLAIPLLLGVFYWYNLQINNKREQYFGAKLFKKLRRGFWPLGKQVRHISLYIGLALLINAAAVPATGPVGRTGTRRSLGLSITPERSGTMNGEYTSPTPLARGK